METDTSHEFYMQQCIQLAQEAMNAGNPPVGCLIVHQGNVIGKGKEGAKTSGDITDHAEIIAIRDAMKNGFADQLSESALYTTHEPCIMCSYAIRHYKIPHIVFGASVDDVGGYSSTFNILSTEKVQKWELSPEIFEGIVKQKCISLTEQFETLNKKNKNDIVKNS